MIVSVLGGNNIKLIGIHISLSIAPQILNSRPERKPLHNPSSRVTILSTLNNCIGWQTYHTNHYLKNASRLGPAMSVGFGLEAFLTTLITTDRCGARGNSVVKSAKEQVKPSGKH